MGQTERPDNVVRTNRGRFVIQALTIGPVAAIAAVIMIIRLVVGYRTSEGMGTTGLLAGLVLAFAPLLLWGAYIVLTIVNSRITYERNHQGWWILRVRTWTTHTHQLNDPVCVPWGKYLLVFDDYMGLVIEKTQWERQTFDRVFGPMPAEDIGPKPRVKDPDAPAWMNVEDTISLAQVRRDTEGRVTRLKGPFRILHSGIYWTIWSIAVIAGIALIVNFDKVLGV